MITIETKDGNVELDEKKILLITTKMPWDVGSIIVPKQGEDIFSTSPIHAVKAALENVKDVFLTNISFFLYIRFFPHIKIFIHYFQRFFML